MAQKDITQNYNKEREDDPFLTFLNICYPEIHWTFNTKTFILNHSSEKSRTVHEYKEIVRKLLEMDKNLREKIIILPTYVLNKKRSNIESVRTLLLNRIIQLHRDISLTPSDKRFIQDQIQRYLNIHDIDIDMLDESFIDFLESENILLLFETKRPDYRHNHLYALIVRGE